MNTKMEEVIINNDSSNSLFTCEICIEPAPLYQKFKNMELSGCCHPFCTDCIAKYIQVKVEQDNAWEIKCPDTNCNMVLDALSCRSILPAEVFDKWCRVLCESAVLLASSQGGFAHGRAYCPFRGCSELILNECVIYSSSSTNIRRRITRSMCPNCRKQFCFHCMVPWQESHRCTSTSGGGGEVDRNDVLFIEMVKDKNWTRCPNCNRYVERIRGCPYIICRCKTQFCYDCGNKSESCSCQRIMGRELRTIMISVSIIFILCLISYFLSLLIFRIRGPTIRTGDARL